MEREKSIKIMYDDFISCIKSPVGNLQHSMWCVENFVEIKRNNFNPHKATKNCMSDIHDGGTGQENNELFNVKTRKISDILEENFFYRLSRFAFCP